MLTDKEKKSAQEIGDSISGDADTIIGAGSFPPALAALIRLTSFSIVTNITTALDSISPVAKILATSEDEIIRSCEMVLRVTAHSICEMADAMEATFLKASSKQ